MLKARQVKSKIKGVYKDTQEYLGKEATVQLEETENGDQPQEAQGILSDLPESIQDYVLSQVADKEIREFNEMKKKEHEQVLKDKLSESLSIKDILAEFDEYIKEDDAQKMGIDTALPQAEEERGQEQPQNAPQQEQPQSQQLTCTEAERAFLDAFLSLQEAGGLLGLTHSGRNISGTDIKNTRLVPVINQIKESDKQYLVEIQEESEVHTLMENQSKIMYKNLEEMLAQKGILGVIPF